MRLPVLLTWLVVGTACGPDPLQAALSAPTPGPARPPVATPGDNVTIEVFEHGLATTTVVSPDGSIEPPLCPAVQVAGLEPSTACEAVAQCMARFFRRTAVRVTIGDEPDSAASQAGCAVEGPPRPDGWAVDSQRVLDAVPRAEALDAAVVIRAVEVAATLEALRVERTDAHPDVLATASRIVRLLDTPPAARGSDVGRVRARVEPMLEAAEQTVSELSTALGPQHPERQIAAVRRDFLAASRAALPAAGVVPSVVADAIVDAVEVATRSRVLEQRVPSHPQPAASPGTDAPCTEVLRAFDLRLAYLEGRLAGQLDGQPPGSDDIPVLQAVIDDLVVARAQLAAKPSC